MLRSVTKLNQPAFKPLLSFPNASRLKLGQAVNFNFRNSLFLQSRLLVGFSTQTFNCISSFKTKPILDRTFSTAPNAKRPPTSTAATTREPSYEESLFRIKPLWLFVKSYSACSFLVCLCDPNMLFGCLANPSLLTGSILYTGITAASALIVGWAVQRRGGESALRKLYNTVGSEGDTAVLQHDELHAGTIFGLRFSVLVFFCVFIAMSFFFVLNEVLRSKQFNNKSAEAKEVKYRDANDVFSGALPLMYRSLVPLLLTGVLCGRRIAQMVIKFKKFYSTLL